MFSTWKTDATSFDPVPRVPEPIAPAIPTTPIRPATAGTVMAAHNKDGFSVINDWLKMRGDLEGDGDILVKGEVYGNIKCKTLIVDLGALVEGGIDAEEVVVRGTARGTIRTQRIRLEKTALVDAEIYHESFSAEEGARVKGMMHASESNARPVRTASTSPSDGKGLAAALKAAAQTQTPGKPNLPPPTPEARVSSALYDMLDVARSTSGSPGA